MAEDYSRSLLRISVAQICQNLGWNSAQSSSLEVLTDVLERFLLKVSGTCHNYTEHYGRTEANLDDLGLAFEQLGISVAELEDYVRHVDPLPFAHEVVAFPAAKTSDLSFPNPRSREILQHREEHVDDHLPYMYPNLKDEILEEKTSMPAMKTETQIKTESDIKEPNAEDDSAAEKRVASSSTPEGPPAKRQRLGNPNLPEEAGHSQYEMTCVFLNQNGVLTTRQGCQGKKPEPRMPPPNPHTMQGSNKENSGKTKDSRDGSHSVSIGGIGVDAAIIERSSDKKTKSKKKGSGHHSSYDQAAKAVLKKLKYSKKPSKAFSKSKFKDLKDQTKDGHSSEKSRKHISESGDREDRKEGKKTKKEKKINVVDSDEELRNLCSPSNSRAASPEQSITSEGGTQKKARLEAINDSINSVLSNSPLKPGRPKKKKDVEIKKGESSVHKGESSSKTSSHDKGKDKEKDKKIKKKPGRKPKERPPPEPSVPVDIKPFVSDRYSTEELQVYEFNDSPPDSSVKPRRLSAAGSFSPVLAPEPPPAPIPPKHKPEREQKSSTTKLSSSSSSLSSSSAIPKRQKYVPAPEEDLFAPEIKFDNPPVKTHDKGKDKLKAKDVKKAKPEENKGKSKEKDVKTDKSKDKRDKGKDEKIKVKTVEIKEDKYKEKDHKKDKKDKKKEKEKKKKHKEKDRDKEKEKKKEDRVKVRIKHESQESRESSPAVGLGSVKLKIKIGGSTASSMLVTRDNSPGSPAPSRDSKRESMSPPRIIPKMYISKEKPKKSSKHQGSSSSKHKSSSLGLSSKSRSNTPSPTPMKREPSPPKRAPTPPPPPRKTPTPPPPRKTPTPPPPRKTPTPPPPRKTTTSPPPRKTTTSPPPRKTTTSPPPRKTPTPPPRKVSPSPASSKDSLQQNNKKSIVSKERRGRSPVKKGRKEKKKHRSASLSSLSSLSSSPSPSKSPFNKSRQSPPKLSRARSSSVEKSPPSLPAGTPEASPRPSPRPERSPSNSSLHNSPTPPPSLTRRKITPPPLLSPAAAKHKRRSLSPSPVKPPTPGSTSPPASPDLHLPLFPEHHPSPNATPRTPTGSPYRELSPTHSSPPATPHRSPSPPVVAGSSSRPSSRLTDTPEQKSLKDNPSPASSVKSTSSVSKKGGTTVETETICVFYNDTGEKVWICPACKMQDDGSEMIGCDTCDNWYHWPCVGITREPPENEDWFCPPCLVRRKAAAASRGRGRPRGRGRGRGKKPSK